MIFQEDSLPHRSVIYDTWGVQMRLCLTGGNWGIRTRQFILSFFYACKEIKQPNIGFIWDSPVCPATWPWTPHALGLNVLGKERLPGAFLNQPPTAGPGLLKVWPC